MTVGQVGGFFKEKLASGYTVNEIISQQVIVSCFKKSRKYKNIIICYYTQTHTQTNTYTQSQTNIYTNIRNS